MEQATVIVGHAQRTELETAFEETVRAASALILAFQLDLASAAIALGRRVRQAAVAEAAGTSELSSIAGTAADLAERAHRNPGRAGAADLRAAAARLHRHASPASVASFIAEPVRVADAGPELLAA